MFKINKLSLITIFSLVTLSSFGQGFYEIDYNYKLLSSGKKKITIFKDSKLSSFTTIDSNNRIITVNNLRNTKDLDNKYATEYNDSMSISYIEKSFYNINGVIDSILYLNYGLMRTSSTGEDIPATVDTILIVYGRVYLGKKILTKKYYSIYRGVKKLYRTDCYGYDKNNRLIILIEDNGSGQLYYEYNKKNQISAYYTSIGIVSFEYDKLGRKSKGFYHVNTSHTYEYNEDSFLIKKTVEGMNSGIFTYKYD